MPITAKARRQPRITAICHLRAGLGSALLAMTGMAFWMPAASAQENQAEKPAQESSDTLLDPSKAVQLMGKPAERSVKELIEDLGSPSYNARRRAKQRLQLMGLEAFDALQRAQEESDNTEVIIAAEYLVASFTRWALASDPRPVVELLSDYGSLTSAERVSRIELLAGLSDRQGLSALARLARFEPSEKNRQRSAMLIIKQPIEGSPERRRDLAKEIRNTIKDDRSLTSTWLLAYANDLQQAKFTVAPWEQLIQNERKRLNKGLDSAVTAASVTELVRTIAGRASREGSVQAATDLAVSNLDLVTPTSKDLADHCDWALYNGLGAVVSELYQMHPLTFSKNAELLYSAGQALAQQGQQAKADSLAAAARKLSPFPEKKDDETGVASTQVLDNIAKTHGFTAKLLESRGMFDWAEAEYKLIVEHGGSETKYGLIGTFDLAEFYSQHKRHQEAVDVLKEAEERLSKDHEKYEELSKLVRASYFQSIVAREKAYALLQKGQDDPEMIKEAKTLLRSAFDKRSTDINILIKLYRLDDGSDTAYTKYVQSRISSFIKSYDSKIRSAEAQIAANRNFYRDLLGQYFNDYAWLVCNTTGNYQLALERSLKSIKLAPRGERDQIGARLDTCARCYFALGDLDNAIKTQKQALENSPHDPSLNRQLKEFEDAKAEQTGAAAS